MPYTECEKCGRKCQRKAVLGADYCRLHSAKTKQINKEAQKRYRKTEKFQEYLKRVKDKKKREEEERKRKDDEEIERFLMEL